MARKQSFLFSPVDTARWMNQAAEGALNVITTTFEWCFNLVKWAFLSIVWAIVTTVGYILRTGFVGFELGNVVSSVYAKVVTIFQAIIESVTHAVLVIPDTVKPLIQMSLFALVQLVLEQLHDTVPQFFSHLLKNDKALNSMKGQIEHVFKGIFSKNNTTGSIQPSEEDITYAVGDIKENLSMAKQMTSAFKHRMQINAWKRRSKQKRLRRSPSMRELTSLCMDTKSKHKSKCAGKGLTKAELQRMMLPYIDLLKHE